MSHFFGRIALVAALFTSAALAAPDRESQQRALANTYLGQIAPDFKLKDLQGNQVQLSALKGKIVLLDFWATWCGPCRMEIPMLQNLSKKLADKDLVVIGINALEPEETVRHFVAKNKLTYPVVLTEPDPTVLQVYNVHAYPTAILIDRDGVIASYRMGVRPGTEGDLHGDFKHVASAKYVAPKAAGPWPAFKPTSGTNGTSRAASVPMPDPNWRPATAREFVARGEVYFRAQKAKEAMYDAEEAIRLKPGWYVAIGLHGRTAANQSDFSTAVKDYSEVLRQKPSWAMMYSLRARAYAHLHDDEHAIADFRKCLELDPDNASVYDALGLAYQEKGDLANAKASFDQAIETQPSFVSYYENRAKLYDQQGDYQSELADVNMVLNLNPETIWAKNLRESVLQKAKQGAEVEASRSQQ